MPVATASLTNKLICLFSSLLSKSIYCSIVNAFHDEEEITYGEKLHAFPEKQQKLVNVIDSQTVEIYIDKDHFSLFSGEVIHFEHILHVDRGFSERIIHWKSPKGKEVKLNFRRLVSFVTPELFMIDVNIEPVDEDVEVRIVSSVNGDVSNFFDPTDPRLASGDSERLSVVDVKDWVLVFLKSNASSY